MKKDFRLKNRLIYYQKKFAKVVAKQGKCNAFYTQLFSLFAIFFYI